MVSGDYFCGQKAEKFPFSLPVIVCKPSGGNKEIRLTNKELLGVKYFAWLLLLQLVGFVWICSCRALPAYSSLAEAFGV